MKFVDCPNCFTSQSDISSVKSDSSRFVKFHKIKNILFGSRQMFYRPDQYYCRKAHIERKHKIKKRDLVRGVSVHQKSGEQKIIKVFILNSKKQRFYEFISCINSTNLVFYI